MSDSPPARGLKEPLLLWGITLLVTVGLSLAQLSVGWLRAYVLLIVAATFIYLPIELLHRRGEDPAALGIHRERPLRSLAWALAVSLVVLGPYLVGFHVWQVTWLERTPTFEGERLKRWPVELEDAPVVSAYPRGEVRLYTRRDDLVLHWRLPEGQRVAYAIEASGPVERRDGGAPLWTSPTGAQGEAGSDGFVIFRVAGDRLRLTMEAGGAPLPAERLRLGTAGAEADAMPFTAERSLGWIWHLLLVQFLLVGLPEEVFYRGYLQTRLDGAVGRDRKILGVQCNPTSLLLTSALFAVAHFATVPSPARLAVFFPSLLFGWLRRASGGVLAPAVFHAACNITVELAFRFYV